MRITNVFSGRPMYYDRNPTVPSITADTAALAPAGATARTTYTVPTARKFKLDALWLMMHRVTVGAPVGQYAVSVTITGLLFVHKVTSLNNAVDAISELNLNATLDILAAGTLSVTTQDASTGGTVDYHGYLNGIEYDA
jgi:hypothetical protein